MADQEWKKRLNDPGYKNWLKVSLALIESKEALHDFTERVMVDVHNDIKTKVSSGICSGTCGTSRGAPSCPSCSQWVREIKAKSGGMLQWRNADPTIWHNTPWEVAKCFMNPQGCKATAAANTGPDKTDLSGMLNVLVNCKEFGLNHLKDKKLPEDVRTVRNELMHCATMSFSDAEMKSKVDTITKFLEDDKELKNLPICHEKVELIKSLKDDDFELKPNDEGLCIDTALKSHALAVESGEKIDDNMKSFFDKLFEIIEENKDLEKKFEDRMNNIDEKLNDAKNEYDAKFRSVEVTLGEFRGKIDSFESTTLVGESCFKNSLQVYTQKKELDLPKYNSQEVEDKHFISTVHVNGKEFKSKEPKQSKKEAEQCAAEEALRFLGSEDMEVSNEKDKSPSIEHQAMGSSSSTEHQAMCSSSSKVVLLQKENYINMLQERAQKLKIPPPIYDNKKVDNGFLSNVMYDGRWYSPDINPQNSKIDAQQSAAQFVLAFLDRSYSFRNEMATAPERPAQVPEPPQAQDGGINVELEVEPNKFKLKFGISTEALKASGVTAGTLGVIYFNNEGMKAVLDNALRCAFGDFGAIKNVSEGSLLVDLECFTLKDVGKVIKDYQCGNVKRRFLEELRKNGVKVENLKIEFKVEETLKLNEKLRRKVQEKTGKSKGTSVDFRRRHYFGSRRKFKKKQTNQRVLPKTLEEEITFKEFLETLNSIEMLNGAQERLIQACRDSQKKKEFVILREAVIRDPCDEHGRNILHYAVRFGYQVGKYLMSDDNVNAQDCDGRTPLHVLCMPRDMIDSGSFGDFEHLKQYNWCESMHLFSARGSLDVKDSEDRTPLHYAALCNQKLVFSLIRCNADIYATDSYGKTPLDYAFQRNKTGAIRHLVEAFARNQEEDKKFLMMEDFSVVDEEGKTILHYAAEFGNDATMNTLLDAGVSLNAIDKHGKYALDYAIKRRNLGITCALLAHVLEQQSSEKPAHLLLTKEALEMKDGNKQTLLHYSVISFKQKVLELLLKCKINIDSCDNFGKTALLYAAELDKVTAIEQLLKAGTNKEEKDKKGKTALHYAVEGGHVVAIEKLLNAGANTEEKDEKGKTALHYAVVGGHAVIIEMLLNARANTGEKDEKGKTALHYAIERDNAGAIEMLLKAGANTEDKDEKGKTALHYAVEGDHAGAIEMLLNAKARIEEKDWKGKTVLHYAAQHGGEQLLDLLLPENTTLNDLDSKGKSVFHYVLANALTNPLKSDRQRLARKLVQAGAKTPLDEQRRTFLGNAVLNKEYKDVDILIKCGVSVDDLDGDGKSALHHAVRLGSTDFVKKLLDVGADANIKDAENRTPLHVAVLQRYDYIIGVLLACKANPSVKDDFGKTPLDYAHEKCRSAEIIRKMEEVIESLSLEGSKD